MEEIIDIIHRNHGVAVIAHPDINLKGKDFLLEEILELGIDGIETFSSYHSQKQTDFYYHATQEKNNFVTCGSDYHGKTKPSIGIGHHNCPIPFAEMIQQWNKRLSCTYHFRDKF